MKKILPVFLIIAVVIGGAAFYGGTKYVQSKTSRGALQGNFRNSVQGGGFRNMGTNGGNGGMGFVAGDIIAKDDKSITVKLRDGSSKIIFYSGATKFGKFVSGTAADFGIGSAVIINGKTNSDGSITGDSIQLRLGASGDN